MSVDADFDLGIQKLHLLLEKEQIVWKQKRFFWKQHSCSNRGGK